MVTLTQTKASILLLTRLGSTRLPGKLLKEVMGRPLLEYQIERPKIAHHPKEIILCTTQLSEDNALIDLANRHGLMTFRGSTEDVLDRMLQAAHLYEIDFIVSIGGDDTLCDPNQIELVINKFWQTQADFIQCRDLPLGGTPSLPFSYSKSTIK